MLIRIHLPLPNFLTLSTQFTFTLPCFRLASLGKVGMYEQFEYLLYGCNLLASSPCHFLHSNHLCLLLKSHFHPSVSFPVRSDEFIPVWEH